MYAEGDRLEDSEGPHTAANAENFIFGDFAGDHVSSTEDEEDEEQEQEQGLGGGHYDPEAHPGEAVRAMQYNMVQQLCARSMIDHLKHKVSRLAATHSLNRLRQWEEEKTGLPSEVPKSFQTFQRQFRGWTAQQVPSTIVCACWHCGSDYSHLIDGRGIKLAHVDPSLKCTFQRKKPDGTANLSYTVCNQPVFRQDLRGLYVPAWDIVTLSLADQLACALQDPTFKAHMDFPNWLAHNRDDVDRTCDHIVHSIGFNTPAPNYASRPDADIEAHLMLSTDWYYVSSERRTDATHVWALTATFLDLPDNMRWAPGNVMLLAMATGPEQTLMGTSGLVEWMLLPQLEAFADGVNLNVMNEPNPILVQARLVCVVSDGPARNKLNGDMAHNGLSPCPCCYLCHKATNKSFFLDPDALAPELKTRELVMAAQDEYCTVEWQSKTHEEDWVRANGGIRPAPLTRAPGYDCVAGNIIDVAHCLLYNVVPQMVNLVMDNMDLAHRRIFAQRCLAQETRDCVPSDKRLLSSNFTADDTVRFQQMKVSRTQKKEKSHRVCPLL